jgi:hypothetical protein
MNLGLEILLVPYQESLVLVWQGKENISLLFNIKSFQKLFFIWNKKFCCLGLFFKQRVVLGQ